MAPNTLSFPVTRIVSRTKEGDSMAQNEISTPSRPRKVNKDTIVIQSSTSLTSPASPTSPTIPTKGTLLSFLKRNARKRAGAKESLSASTKRMYLRGYLEEKWENDITFQTRSRISDLLLNCRQKIRAPSTKKEQERFDRYEKLLEMAFKRVSAAIEEDLEKARKHRERHAAQQGFI